VRCPLSTELTLEYIGESASVAFHRKIRQYVKSQGEQNKLGHRVLSEPFPQSNDPSESPDLASAEEPTDLTASPPSILANSPRSGLTTSPTSIRSHLPPRHRADTLIDQFFKQIHSIFWAFPRDQFLRRLDKTYLLYELEVYGGPHQTLDEHERREIEAPSWMCCLFTVLALGCSTNEEIRHDAFNPSDFFSIAKHLAHFVVEDESIQSIQALLLMVLILF
jgi:hypothetical protein